MEQQERKQRIQNKCFASISFLELEIDVLINETPYLSFTQEMIDGQICFKKKELEVWNHIAFLNELDA